MIDVEASQGRRTIFLNRPDKANSLTAEMLSDLVETVRNAQDARALILTGRGKVFSAGADLEAARALRAANSNAAGTTSRPLIACRPRS